MEVKRPIPRQRLRADWGRAVADGLSASQLSGDGVLRTPAGTSIPPIQPPPVPVRPARRPFDVQIGAYKSNNQLVMRFSVVPGKVWHVSGTSVAELAYSATDFTAKGSADGFDGTHWVCDAPSSANAAKYLCACLTYSGSSVAPAGWTLRLLDSTSRTGETCLPVAILTPASGGGWRIEQLRLGEIFVNAGGGASDPRGGLITANDCRQQILSVFAKILSCCISCGDHDSPDMGLGFAMDVVQFIIMRCHPIKKSRCKKRGSLFGSPDRSLFLPRSFQRLQIFLTNTADQRLSRCPGSSTDC